jgi:hypothetical protein
VEIRSVNRPPSWVSVSAPSEKDALLITPNNNRNKTTKTFFVFF